ncbi:hypothetical protein FVEN_g12947 [Fusarium venenatum]|nr:hypothetical protein FVEN_g12947 [Fusarium venenatum]
MDLSLQDQSLVNLAALALTRLPELEFGRAAAQGPLQMEVSEPVIGVSLSV